MCDKTKYPCVSINRSGDTNVRVSLWFEWVFASLFGDFDIIDAARYFGGRPLCIAKWENVPPPSMLFDVFLSFSYRLQTLLWILCLLYRAHMAGCATAILHQLSSTRSIANCFFSNLFLPPPSAFQLFYNEFIDKLILNDNKAWDICMDLGEMDIRLVCSAQIHKKKEIFSKSMGNRFFSFRYYFEILFGQQNLHLLSADLFFAIEICTFTVDVIIYSGCGCQYNPLARDYSPKIPKLKYAKWCCAGASANIDLCGNKEI